MYLRIYSNNNVEYPYELSSLYKSYSNVSFPNQIEIVLPDYGIFPVKISNPPEYDPKSEKVIEGVPVLTSEGWTQVWHIIKLSTDEVNFIKDTVAARVLEERSKKLQESDWTQGKDIPDEISVKWQLYRQALRDITTQLGFPFEVVWPTKPE